MATQPEVGKENPAAFPAWYRTVQSNGSGVSWSAVFAGATAGAALSFVLFILGTGLGLSAVSIWSGKGADGEAIGWATIGWLTFTQLAAAGVGGYLAGRLRTKWTGIHTTEVFFRDTAHGFLAWSLATVLLFLAIGVAGGAVVKESGKAVAAVTDTVASTTNYWAANVFQNAPPDPVSTPARVRTNVARTADVVGIFKRGLETGELAAPDVRYLGQVIAANSQLTQADAEARVQSAFVNLQHDIQKAKEKAEVARKATAYSLLWASIALFIGAFVASICATIGGRQRDRL